MSLTACHTADDVRQLARRQAQWRRQQYQPRPVIAAPEPVIVASEPEPIPAPALITPPPLNPAYPPIARIQRIVCARFNISVHDMISDRRMAHLVRPRHVAMWLAKKLTVRSLPEIGRRFGGRDHTTVLHAIKSIEARRAADPELAALLDELEREILA